jgi:hypothetical protein
MKRSAESDNESDQTEASNSTRHTPDFIGVPKRSQRKSGRRAWKYLRYLRVAEKGEHSESDCIDQ